MGSRFTQIVIALVVLFFGFILVTNNSGDNGGDAPDVSSNHVKGNPDAKVTLVEYGDFQCPACRAFYPVVKQIAEEYKDDVQFQFKHFPLVQIHPNAFAASRAAEAAGRQGKFFEMHDLLYEEQASWSSLPDPLNTFVTYATQLGLDEEAFKTDYSSSEINDIVNGDFQDASEAGATSTPTFVLNGQRLSENPGSIDAFRELLDNAIAKNQ